MAPVTFGVNSLAQAIGVTQQQVSQWKAAGMPFGRTGRILLKDAVRWLRDHERRERPRIGASEANERRAAAEAELAELKLARERGDVVLAAEALAKMEDENARVAGILAQLASEYAPLVASRTGCGLRDASAVLREIGDGLRRRLAAGDTDTQEEAA